MQIEELKIRKSIEDNKRLFKAYKKMQTLIEAVNKKDIPEKAINSISKDIILLNDFIGTDKELTKSINKTYSKILKFVENELKLLPKNYYRNLWMVLGMIFGVALGSTFSSFFDNSIGLGIPIGMVLGLALGSKLDKNTKDDGKQLDF